MKTHLEMKHHSVNAPDMGAWDIIGEKQAYICEHKGRGFVGITEKAKIAHNTQQHQSEAAWEKAMLTVQLGVVAPPEGSRDPVKEFNIVHEAFLARKDMTIEEAEATGLAWRLASGERPRSWTLRTESRRNIRAEPKSNTSTRKLHSQR
jgi:hypothetical protein